MHKKSVSFLDRSATVCPIDFQSTTIDAPETTASFDAKQLDRNCFSPSPQTSQHFSVTAKLITGHTHKVGVLPRPLSHRLSHRLPVENSRCSRDTSILRRRTTRPELKFSVTASVTTLFHNYHSKYRINPQSRSLSTTAPPPYVPSTSGQRRSMIRRRPHSMTPNSLTVNSIPRHRKRHNTFPFPPCQLQGIHTKSSYFHDRSATRCPTDFRSKMIDAPKSKAFSDDKRPHPIQYSPSPQASQHLSINATLITGNTHKVDVFPRPLSRRKSHRLSVNSNRCTRDTSIL
jgi:hypothetical protein